MSVRWVLGSSLLVSACFSPTPPTGVPCVTDTDCPGSQICHPITLTCETSCTNCTPPDGPPGDSDGPGVTCWDGWLAGNVQLTSPQALDGLTMMNASVSNPSVSTDGLALYFARNQDLFRASRQTLDDEFGDPALIVVLRTDANESRISTTGDDQVAVFASARPGTLGLLDLWQTSRTILGTFSPPSSLLFGAINDANNQFDPEITPDGLHLYWAPSVMNEQLIHHASRPTIDDPFEQVTTLDIPIDDIPDIFDPTISPDQRVLVFAGQRDNAQGDLFVTTRASADQPFSTAVLVPGVNTNGFHEGDSELSADGCTLYFVSNRDGLNKIYRAELVR